ncbi:alpha beta hydrolase protein [Echria macrotheca]|uniref:Alpha beta hydrolase protein n=1 Tax=Echria macrotheca TaxID=438768 RepID=A0AAJ0F1T8_9PEZI|nr:alpha beta hydrolase protein [Echria macrotheca]
MPFLQRNDQLRLWYLDEGHKTALPILLIHGLTCDLHDWSWQVQPLLSLGFRVITFDLRGHGKSSAPPSTPDITSWPGPDALDRGIVDYYPQTCAYDAVALLQHLDIRRTIVVGHSLGDVIGYYLTVARPDLVVANVGIDPIHCYDNAFREANESYFDDPTNVISKLVFFFSYTYPPDAPHWQKTWHVRRAQEMDEGVVYALSWGTWGDRRSLARKEIVAEEYRDKRKCPRLTLGSSEFAVVADRDVLPRVDGDEITLDEGKGHWFHQVDYEVVNKAMKEWFAKNGVLPE